jgi:hypothetical protein
MDSHIQQIKYTLSLLLHTALSSIVRAQWTELLRSLFSTNRRHLDEPILV